MTSANPSNPAARAEVTAVVRLIRSMTAQSQQYADAVRKLVELPRADLVALGFVADRTRDGDPPSLGELAEHLHLSNSAITALVDRLEGVGHVQRQGHPKDRRKTCVSITEHAAQVSSAAFSPLSDEIRQALSGYSSHELALVSQVLTEVTHAMSRACENIAVQTPESLLPAAEPRTTRQ